VKFLNAKLFAVSVLFVMAANATAVPMSEKPIEIKGISIGMPREQFEKIVNQEEYFTIGGARSKYRTQDGEYVEGKLDQYIFFFGASKFDDVLEAVKEKYPSISCIDTQVSNAMGASFQQTSCSINDATSTLNLTRLADIKTSALMLISKRKLDEKEKRRQQGKKDI
jgi:hypothetical protein